ncbi:uncharacterized protein TNCV_3869351 [Trichonephila clavipes]|nr:uncharacterized protein TNCV_3869351 [Trichonephila clavipes]
MMVFWGIFLTLYVIGWIWYNPVAGSDMEIRFYGHHCHLSNRWVFFPMEQSQGICVLRLNDHTNGLCYLSACCMYFEEYRAAATCALINSTAHSSLPQNARRRL